MPNRIIKESICVSESIDSLSWFDEVFFYRLIVNCDDYGRLDARPAILKARLFPLKDIPADGILDALHDLEAAGMVLLYESGKKPFLQLVSWEAHQSIRAKRSKYPAPENQTALVGGGLIPKPQKPEGSRSETPDGNCSDRKEIPKKAADCQGNKLESTCRRIQADAGVCVRNPIQTNPKQNPYPNPNPADRACLFDEFWTAYPKKAGKKDARRVWEKLSPSRDLAVEIIQGLMRWRKSEQWCKDEGRFVPYPATFLNGERWKDECTLEASFAKGRSNPGTAGNTAWTGENVSGNYDYQEIARIAAEKLKGKGNSAEKQKEDLFRDTIQKEKNGKADKAKEENYGKHALV